MSDAPLNLLFIMTDQQRWDALGCETPWLHTPHLDRLAADGTRFTSCYTDSPVCVPTRLSLATGLAPHATGVWQNRQHDLSPRCPTWMQVLRAGGYRTSLFGKTHLHRHEGDLRDREHLMHAYGLDDIDEIGGPRASSRVLSRMTARWQELGLWQAYQEDVGDRFATTPWLTRPSPLPLEEYADVYVGTRAAEYLADYNRDQPWCCWVSFGGPHEPWDTPEPWASHYERSAMPPAVPRPTWFDERADTVIAKRHGRRPDGFDAAEMAAMKADYAGNISLIDEQVGRLLRVLEDRGELERTVIVFTSDHGEHNGDFGRIYKETFLECSARVPLLIRDPRRPGGQVVDAPVQLMDVGATLVDAGGLAFDYEQHAASLLPCLADPTARPRSIAVCEYRGEICAIDGRWKLWLAADGTPYALTDRREDPDEQTNRFHDPGQHERILELRCALQEHLARQQLHEPREIRAREEDLVATR